MHVYFEGLKCTFKKQLVTVVDADDDAHMLPLANLL